MDIRHELFTIVGQCSKKFRIVSIKTIKADPFESHPIFSCTKDHLKRLFMLGLEDNLIFGDFGFLAAFLILYPFFGEIESEIYRCRKVPSAESSKNCNLAIVDLAELTTPLSAYSYRFLTFLGDSGFVNIQSAIIITTKQLVTITRYLVIYRVPVPIGI